MLYRAVLTFESVNAIFKFDHLNESYWALYFPVMLMKVVITLAFVHAVLHESYWVTVLFDTRAK